MPRRKTDEQVIMDAAKDPEKQKKLEKQTERLEKRMERAINGNTYHGKELHEAYSVPVLHRQINSYFKLCEMKKKPMTVPGLALAIGVRTEELKAYSPINPEHAEYRRLIEYALQRIESWMADSLCTGTGSTKGREFLAMNTLNYAAKSNVNSTASLEITDKDRVKRLSDDELIDQATLNIEKINAAIPNLRPLKAPKASGE